MRTRCPTFAGSCILWSFGGRLIRTWTQVGGNAGTGLPCKKERNRNTPPPQDTSGHPPQQHSLAWHMLVRTNKERDKKEAEERESFGAYGAKECMQTQCKHLLLLLWSLFLLKSIYLLFIYFQQNIIELFAVIKPFKLLWSAVLGVPTQSGNTNTYYWCWKERLTSEKWSKSLVFVGDWGSQSPSKPLNIGMHAKLNLQTSGTV